VGILRDKPPISPPSLVSFRASVVLWRAWYRNRPGDFLDLAGKLRDLWDQAGLIEGMIPPPPLPAAALGVMPSRDRVAVEIALAALESLLRWCDGAERPATSAATDIPGESDYVWLSPAEAATCVGRCSKTITNWIREGMLHSYGRSGRRYRFLKSELDAKKLARKPRKPR
jgi:excisionase family DNA binding protein